MMVLRGSQSRAAIAGLAIALGACSDDVNPPRPDYRTDSGLDAPRGDGPRYEGAPPGKVLPGPSKGSAVALSPDDSVAVVCNREVGTVTVLALSYPATGAPTAKKTAELDLGADSEPWQAVVGPDGDTAYVVLRKAQRAVKLEKLRTAPVKGGEVAVGSEPTGLALVPTGAELWVTNFVDGTLSVIATSSMTVARTIDLNKALVATGYLGSVKERPALAYPRAIAITNNGDGKIDDETAYVVEYFGQRFEAEQADGSNADTSKRGVVYRVDLGDDKVTTIPLAPLADMGFKDQNGGTAGCFPNQLQSVAVNGENVYVVSICASPEGPIGPFAGPAACTQDSECGANGGKCTAGKCEVNNASVKTATAPLVSVINRNDDSERTNATASLNAKFDELFTKAGTADDATRRYPLVANDIAFVPGGGVGYLTANGTDAVFRVKYGASGPIEEVGASTNPFINLGPAGITPPEAAGRLPIGLAITTLEHGGKRYAVVANEGSRNLTIVDFNTQAIAGGAASPSVTATTALPGGGTQAERVLRGKRFFNTGLGRWSLKGQGWGACQSCHTDGLTDNVTWYFARGPRQSTSLDGTYASKDPTDQRLLNWTAIFDELADFELNTRGVSGGVGAIVSKNSAPPVAADRIDIATKGHAGLNGSAAAAADPASTVLAPDPPSVLNDWGEITAYVQTIRSPRAPRNLDPSKVAAGKTLFSGGSCQGCHGGAKWTISKLFYAPSVAAGNGLKTKVWTPPAGFPAALLPAATASNRFMRFGGANPAAFDQLQCILRPVGTFNVAESGVGIAELRVDMKTPGQGNEIDGKGFNPPSLLGANLGAPFLHAGNARTLEALFSPTFKAHYTALAPNFLADADPSAKVEQLVQFLLSIDEDATPVSAPAPGAEGGDFCAAP